MVSTVKLLSFLAMAAATAGSSSGGSREDLAQHPQHSEPDQQSEQEQRTELAQHPERRQGGEHTPSRLEAEWNKSLTLAVDKQEVALKESRAAIADLQGRLDNVNVTESARDLVQKVFSTNDTTAQKRKALEVSIEKHLEVLRSSEAAEVSAASKEAVRHKANVLKAKAAEAAKHAAEVADRDANTSKAEDEAQKIEKEAEEAAQELTNATDEANAAYQKAVSDNDEAVEFEAQKLAKEEAEEEQAEKKVETEKKEAHGDEKDDKREVKESRQRSPRYQFESMMLVEHALEKVNVTEKLRQKAEETALENAPEHLRNEIEDEIRELQLLRRQRRGDLYKVFDEITERSKHAIILDVKHIREAANTVKKEGLIAATARKLLKLKAYDEEEISDLEEAAGQAEKNLQEALHTAHEITHDAWAQLDKEIDEAEDKDRKQVLEWRHATAKLYGKAMHADYELEEVASEERAKERKEEAAKEREEEHKELAETKQNKETQQKEREEKKKHEEKKSHPNFLASAGAPALDNSLLALAVFGAIGLLAVKNIAGRRSVMEQQPLLG